MRQMFGFFDPLTIVRIWNLFALQNLRNFPYYVHFSMTPPSDADIITGSPQIPLHLGRSVATLQMRRDGAAAAPGITICRLANSFCYLHSR